MMVGVDAHKKSCTAIRYDETKRKVLETSVFPTSKTSVTEFMEHLPEGTTVVVESSTTGKAITKLIPTKLQVQMVAPPERKPSVKTDERDALRIVKEDMLGYLRRCYVPSPYIEELRLTVAKQIEIGEKISRVKGQIHALIERNMLQSELNDMSDIFGVQGLERLSSLELPKHESISLAMYLEELKLYTQQHEQMNGEMAKVALSDEDCRLLMSHPGIAPFVAVAIKARTGDASRFPTKKHFCSYAGVVPKADNSGEHVSEHSHVKHGDNVLKYALTCAVRGAVSSKTDTAVKRLYLKQVRRGKSEQGAEVNAARKLACIVWKILTSRKRYAEEDRYLTARKTYRASLAANRSLAHATKPGDIPTLIKELTPKTQVLEMYAGGVHRRKSRHATRKRSSSSAHDREEGMAKK
jgi:transposase